MENKSLKIGILIWTLAGLAFVFWFFKRDQNFNSANTNETERIVTTKPSVAGVSVSSEPVIPHVNANPSKSSRPPKSQLAKFEAAAAHRAVHGADEEKQGMLPRERDSILRQADLAKEVQPWDHLDRDLLLLKAAHFSKEELRVAYPQIPEEKLDRLQSLIHSRSAEDRL